MTTPAGWYPDPTQVDIQRYWDGEHWTNQRAPAPAAAASPPANVGNDRIRRNLGLMLIGLLGLGLFLVGTAGEDDPTGPGPSETAELIGTVGLLLMVVGLIGLLKLINVLLSSRSN